MRPLPCLAVAHIYQICNVFSFIFITPHMYIDHNRKCKSILWPFIDHVIHPYLTASSFSLASITYHHHFSAAPVAEVARSRRSALAARCLPCTEVQQPLPPLLIAGVMVDDRRRQPSGWHLLIGIGLIDQAAEFPSSTGPCN